MQRFARFHEQTSSNAMDPFSQAGLGAVVAQVAGHRQLGFKAALLGAGAGALPDIDVLFSITGDFVDQLITHRGITHSLFFAPIVGPALGWLIWYREKRRDASIGHERRTAWIIAMTAALLSHPLLDLLTPYGTQLLLPFSNARFAINAMPIIDPIYTLLLFLGLFGAWLISRFNGRTEVVAAVTLLVSSAYLGYGWLQNHRAYEAASTQLAQEGFEIERISAFPTMLQVHFRRIVARSSDIDRVGFYSTWSPCEISWFDTPRAQTDDYRSFLNTRAGRTFDWFAMGWVHYRVTSTADQRMLVASDLRYGFDDDPLASIFNVSVALTADGEIAGPAMAGRQFGGEAENAIVRLIENAYAPACRLFSAGVIVDTMNDNAATEPTTGLPTS